MKPQPNNRPHQHAELLITADGGILAHNITPEMSEILFALDPGNRALRERVQSRAQRDPFIAQPHEASN